MGFKGDVRELLEKLEKLTKEAKSLIDRSKQINDFKIGDKYYYLGESQYYGHTLEVKHSVIGGSKKGTDIRDLSHINNYKGYYQTKAEAEAALERVMGVL